jgi:hypothetical protein
MGFLTRNKIVVAREYICKGNNIVSIAEKVLNAAYRREMMVLMYVDDLNDFLSFDPVRVFEQGETNVRGLRAGRNKCQRRRDLLQHQSGNRNQTRRREKDDQT